MGLIKKMKKVSQLKNREKRKFTKILYSLLLKGKCSLDVMCAHVSFLRNRDRVRQETQTLVFKPYLVPLLDRHRIPHHLH